QNLTLMQNIFLNSNEFVTVDWGDGSEGANRGGSPTVSLVANPSGGFDVLGSHTYAQIGNYTITINAFSFRNGPRVLGTLPVTTSSYIQASGVQQLFVVNDAPLSAGAVTPPQHATIDVPISNALLFHFTDANPFATASDYTASVKWGDH